MFKRPFIVSKTVIQAMTVKNNTVKRLIEHKTTD